MVLVRCESCGSEFDFPHANVVKSIRRCGNCGMPTLKVLDEEQGPSPERDAGAAD